MLTYVVGISPRPIWAGGRPLAWLAGAQTRLPMDKICRGARCSKHLGEAARPLWPTETTLAVGHRSRRRGLPTWGRACSFLRASERVGEPNPQPRVTGPGHDADGSASGSADIWGLGRQLVADAPPSSRCRHVFTVLVHSPSMHSPEASRA